MTNDLARIITEFERRLAKLESAAGSPQLNHASITGTTITVYDKDGQTPLQYIGLQGDGTVGTVAVNGPTPPAPLAPTLDAGQLSLTVIWDGGFVDEDGDTASRPTDVTGVQVHMSTVSGFDPSAATLRGVLSVAGSLVVTPLTTEEHYVQLVAVTSSGSTSEPSAEVAGTPDEVVPGDNTVTETKIADDSISTPKLQANVVTSDKIAANAIIAGLIAAGAVTAETLAADSVTADAIATGALDAQAIHAGTLTLDAASGNLLVYSGPATVGNLFISLSPAGGIDSFGNAFPAGIRVFNNGDIVGADVVLNTSSGTIWAYKQ